MIKRLLFGFCGLLTLLFVLGVLGVIFFFDRGLESGLEQIGSRLADAPIEVGRIETSFLKGTVELRDLTIHNPEGFEGDYAIQIGKAEVEIEPSSVFEDVIIVKHIRISSPAVAIEQMGGSTNLGRLQKNLNAVLGDDEEGDAVKEAPAPDESPAGGKRYIIEEFLVADGHLSGTALGASLNAPLPRIELKNLGARQNGFTAEEAGGVMITAILKAVSRATAGTALDALKDPNRLLEAAQGLADSYLSPDKSSE